MSGIMGPPPARVAVIGAGITGMVAARRLALKGHAVAVYEAAGEIGGLAAGFTLKNGRRLERAYHFLYPTDRHLLGLANELGLGGTIRFHRSSIGAFYRGTLYPLITARDLLRFPALGWAARLRTGLVALRLQSTRRWEPLARITAMDWLNRHNGRQAAEALWQPLLRGKFDRYYDRISMAWLWGRIKQRQDSRRMGAKHETLGYPEGGFGSLLAALEQGLAALRARIHTGTPAESIDHDSTGGLILTAAGRSSAYDAVLATVPGPIFAALIGKHPAAEEAYKERLRSIEYLDAILMVLVTPQKLSDYFWHQFHDRDAPFLAVLSLTALTRDTAPFGGNHVYYVGNYVPSDHPLRQKSCEAIRVQWLEKLRGVFPHFDPGAVAESHVFRFRNAQHVVDVGYEKRKLAGLRTPIPGVYLANFSQVFPQDRGVNYAVRDGEAAASAIDRDLRGRGGPGGAG